MIPDVEKLKKDLADTEAAIKKLEPGKMYTDRVADSFHLGMVGGSGRNTYRLNKRRERDLDRTIDTAVKLVPLYKTRDGLNNLIQSIESGEYQRKLDQKERAKYLKITWWKQLKPGDSAYLWTGAEVIVGKMNKKSFVDTTGCKWSAAEIIGSELAAKL